MKLFPNSVHKKLMESCENSKYIHQDFLHPNENPFATSISSTQFQRFQTNQTELLYNRLLYEIRNTSKQKSKLIICMISLMITLCYTIMWVFSPPSSLDRVWYGTIKSVSRFQQRCYNLFQTNLYHKRKGKIKFLDI